MIKERPRDLYLNHEESASRARPHRIKPLTRERKMLQGFSTGKPLTRRAVKVDEVHFEAALHLKPANKPVNVLHLVLALEA